MKNNFFDKTFASLDTYSKGFSARKLSAFAVMFFCVISSHVAWLVFAILNKDFSMFPTLLTMDYGFITLCLGMTTYSDKKDKDRDNKTIV